MLKYKHIIDKLTDTQKIRLLTDIQSLTQSEFRDLGIPPVRSGYIGNYAADRYPASAVLANSWDRELIRTVAKDTYRTMASDGINHFIVPGPKIKISPYRSVLSEDPYLASQISGQFLKAADDINGCATMSELSITADETNWLDDEPDSRVLAEYVIDPYRRAAHIGRCMGVFTDMRANSDAYNAVNIAMADAVTAGKFGENEMYSFCRYAGADDVVSYVGKGRLCMQAPYQTLEAAYSRYNKLQASISTGLASVGELETEVAEGKAISPEMLDNALDRVLEFAFSCSGVRPFESLEPNEERSLSRRAARESTVLLKNEGGLLPLKKKAKQKVAVLGDIFGVGDDGLRNVDRLLEYLDRRHFKEKDLERMRYVSSEYSRGYDICSSRSEDLICDAYRLASESDVVIVFLGDSRDSEKHAAQNGKLTLPANQLALMDALKSFSHKTVAVISGNFGIDVTFTKNVAACLFAPLGVKHGVVAAIDIICGVYNPTGRLASTLYYDTEYGLEKQRAYRTEWGAKAGRFIGYRYYDLLDYNVGFPFGHGLSYTKFTYSNLTIKNGEILFDVTNSGRRGGVEVAQVYLGINNSTRMRPLKELIGFSRVELEAGETATVRIKLRETRVYDPQNNRYVKEMGEYTVYVGASVSDIRLTRNVNLGDTVLEDIGERRSDYLQSESNIISDNYTLEANYKRMKKSAINLVFGIAALALAISLQVYCAFESNESGFLDVLSGILAFGGVVMFVWDYINKKRETAARRSLIDAANKEYFESADELPVYTATEMFVEAFEEDKKNVVEVEKKKAGREDDEYYNSINQSLTYIGICSDFEKFALERGYSFKSDTVKEIFSSFAASRLMIIKGMSNENFVAFVSLFSEYFGCKLRVDNVNDSYVNEESVLFGRDDYDHKYKRNALLAIEAANRKKYDVAITALTDVKLGDISNYFVPFARYIRNPQGSNSVLALNERNISTAYVIPQNLWFILNLAESETVDNMPEYITDIATVNYFEFGRCIPSESHTEVATFKYPQVEHLENANKAISEIDEDTWRRIDKLETYVNGFKDYSIGNKLWTSVEKYIEAYLACNGERAVAIDKAIAYKMLPSILVALKNCEFEEGKDLISTLDRLFGSENTYYCRKMIEIDSTVTNIDEDSNDYYEGEATDDFFADYLGSDDENAEMIDVSDYAEYSSDDEEGEEEYQEYDYLDEDESEDEDEDENEEFEEFDSESPVDEQVNETFLEDESEDVLAEEEHAEEVDAADAEETDEAEADDLDLSAFDGEIPETEEPSEEDVADETPEAEADDLDLSAFDGEIPETEDTPAETSEDGEVI